jgi:hypothetical protein
MYRLLWVIVGTFALAIASSAQGDPSVDDTITLLNKLLSCGVPLHEEDIASTVPNETHLKLWMDHRYRGQIKRTSSGFEESANAQHTVAWYNQINNEWRGYASADEGKFTYDSPRNIEVVQPGTNYTESLRARIVVLQCVPSTQPCIKSTARHKSYNYPAEKGRWETGNNVKFPELQMLIERREFSVPVQNDNKDSLFLFCSKEDAQRGLDAFKHLLTAIAGGR